MAPRADRRADLIHGGSWSAGAGPQLQPIYRNEIHGSSMLENRVYCHCCFLILSLFLLAGVHPSAFGQQALPAEEVVFQVDLVQVDGVARDAIALKRVPHHGADPGSRAELDRFNQTSNTQVHILETNAEINQLLNDQVARGGAEVLASLQLRAAVGREATYLIGGRQAIPVIEDSAGAGPALALNVDDQELIDESGILPQRPPRAIELGIRLAFFAVPLEDGKLRMRVNTRTRTLDFGQSTLRGGVFEPAIVSRFAQRYIDLEPGQSAVLTGLIGREMLSKLSNIAGLEKRRLFTRVRDQHDANPDTSLLAIVTPQLLRSESEGN